MKDLVIGCDVGTSTTKAVVMDAQGQVLCSAKQSYGLLFPCNQWAEQWPQVWLDAVVNVICQLTTQIDSGRVAAVCISALYGGTGVLLDEANEVIRPAMIWMDRRAEAETEELRREVGEEAIFNTTGNGIDSYFGYVKLLWMQRHEPELWAKVRLILPIHSYIIWKMTSEISTDFCSAGNLGGLYDIHQATWSEEMCRLLHVDMNLLPQKLHRPDEVVGTLNPEYAQKLNLPIGTPFLAGTVDCIASMLSAGIVYESNHAAILGTSLNWGFVHKTSLDDPKFISMPYCIDCTQMNYTYGGASTAGALPRWYVKQILSLEEDRYGELEQEVFDQNIPAGSNGLLMLPYFMGERTPVWDEKASGLLLGLSLKHTRAHIYRAILESTAYSLRHMMESANKPAGGAMILVGGGGNSTLWKQILADVTRKTIITLKNNIEAPMGDAFMAAMAMGLQTEYQNIRSWIQYEHPTMPNPDASAVYDLFYENYKQAYPAIKDVMHQLKKAAEG